MKKSLLFITFLVIFLGTFVGLNAVTTWTVPGTYATVAEAVTGLNGLGALTDSYVVDVAPGHAETLTGRITLTATGTASYSITIKKSSAGTNPLLTAYVGTGLAVAADGMFALSGSDYVTIDGIDLYDPNVTAPNSYMEYGYGLFKASVTDGAQYNTIQNCTITLNRNNVGAASGPITEGSTCITMPNSLLSAPGTALTPTSAAGANSYNRFYANYLTNANYGIAMIGYAAATPFNLGDYANDVGGTASGTGNQIINYGGGTGATLPSAAIRGNNQWGWNASYNVIDSNNGSGVNHPNTLRGIYAQAGTSASCNLNYNTVSIKGAGTTSQLSGIECGIGSTAAGNTVNINNNTVTGAYTTSTTGAFYAIYASSSPTTLNMNNNVISNITLPGTGSMYALYSSSTPVNLIANYNQIYNITKSGASGAFRGASFSTSLITFTYNEIHDCTIPSTSGTSAATIYGYYNLASATAENYSNNQIYNLSIGGAGTSTGAIIQGIYSYTVAGSTKTMNDNLVYGLQYTAAGAASVIGIRNNTGTVQIGRNKVYNLATAGTAGVVIGISIEGGTLVNAHNNMIYGLQAPGSTTVATSPAIRGIAISGGATNNVHYNSVYLTYAGANAYFATAGLYITSGTTNEIRNNIFDNQCTPGASGRSVAIWKSTTGITNLGINSNKNIYWTGNDPDALRPIAYISTTAYPTLAEYKTFVADRDQGSYSEAIPWSSFSRDVDLHIDPSVATRVEGNAVAILALCDVDFDNENRNDGTPDIGADEGDFTPVVAPPGIPTYSSPGNTATGIAINAPLVWSANAEGGTPTSYEVYFDQADGSMYYETVGASPSNPPKTWGKTYYWKIKAFNGEGDAEGPVWSFSTANGVPALTYPSDTATGIPGMFTFTWGAVAGAGSYKISVGTTPGGTDIHNMTACVTNSYIQAAALSYLTPYYWSVYAVNGGDEVQSAEWSFTTMADPTVYDFPYSESFTGTTFPPTNWLNIKLAGTGTGLWDRQTVGTYPTCTPHNAGVAMARFNSYSFANGTMGILVTPPISFGTDLYKITFWMYRDTGYGTAQYADEGVKVFYSPVPSLSGATEIGYVHRNITYAPVVGAEGWYEYQFSIPATKGRGIGYLAFEGISNYGNNMFIDDLVVSAIPAAPVFAITPTSKDYGTLQIGTTSEQVFTISNSGINPLVIAEGGITLNPTNAAYLLTDTNIYPISLTGANTASVTVTFQPTVASPTPVEVDLQIVDNTTRLTQTVPLTGIGIDMTIYELPHYVTLSETPVAENWMQYMIGTGVTARWGLSASANAGGLTPEFACAYQNINPGTTRLVSPPISVTGLSELVVKYNQQIDDFGIGCTYKFRYGFDVDNFTNLWTFASASNTDLPVEEKVFSLTTELAGHDKVYFCWEIEGNLYQFDYWYIDNIKFLTTNTEVNQATAVAGAVDIDLPAIINLTTEAPLLTSVQVSGMTDQTPLIDVDVAYSNPFIDFHNDGLYMHLTGTLFDGTRIQGEHNLGFDPPRAAYRFNNGPWTFVDPTPPTVLVPESFFDIFLEEVGKAGDDVEVVFPLNEDDPLPVELSSFTAVLSAENYVNLTWVTQSETGVQGYYVYRSSTVELTDALIVSPMIDATNSAEQHAYQYTDNELTEDGTYYYWLQNVDFGGSVAYHGPVSVYYNTSGDDPTPEIPLFTALNAVYPNPFNPIAYIPYGIAKTADVTFKIYNSRGQLLRNFDLGTKAPGNYRITWDGKDSNGSTCGNGIYYFVMKADKDSFQRKAVLLK